MLNCIGHCKPTIILRYTYNLSNVFNTFLILSAFFIVMFLQIGRFLHKIKSDELSREYCIGNGKRVTEGGREKVVDRESGDVIEEKGT